MPIPIREKGLGVTSKSRNAFLFKARYHCQGYVEAVVEGTVVSVGPRRDNNLASMYLMKMKMYVISSLDIIDSIFALSANEHKTGQSGHNFFRTLYEM